MTIDHVGRRVRDALTEARFARRRLGQARQALLEAKVRGRIARDARQVVQQVAELVQRRAHARLAAVVTRCLQAVFGRRYRFEIEFRRKRGKTEAKFWVVEGALRLDPIGECSGGMVEVVAYGLRVACVLILPVRKVLVLDEPFKSVSRMKRYRKRVVRLVTMLAAELKVQHVVVTHLADLKIGKVVRV